MITQPYHLYIERRDPDRNMARFYALAIEETLFGQTRVVRRWGRIGTTGRIVQHSFDEEAQAVELFLELLRAKRLRGYATPRGKPIRSIATDTSTVVRQSVVNAPRPQGAMPR